MPAPLALISLSDRCSSWSHTAGPLAHRFSFSLTTLCPFSLHILHDRPNGFPWIFLCLISRHKNPSVGGTERDRYRDPISLLTASWYHSIWLVYVQWRGRFLRLLGSSCPYTLKRLFLIIIKSNFKENMWYQTCLLSTLSKWSSKCQCVAWEIFEIVLAVLIDDERTCRCGVHQVGGWVSHIIFCN